MAGFAKSLHHSFRAFPAALAFGLAASVAPSAATAQDYTSGYVQLALGTSHSCALRHDGQVFCWGRNNHGQLGVGLTLDIPVPVKVTSPAPGFGTNNIAAIAARDDTVCALNDRGRAFCWGANTHGQLGDGTTDSRTRPVQVEGLGTGVREISVGQAHSCAVDASGGALCWGRNTAGQIGDGTFEERLLPVAVDTSAAGFGRNNIARISASETHTCARNAGGRAYCWGNNDNGRLGDGTTFARNRPVPVDTSHPGFDTRNIAAITTGGRHSCALTTGGRAFCWGHNIAGQLGVGSTTSAFSRPEPMSTAAPGFGARNIARIVGGGFHGCALNAAGRAFCWGSNAAGEVGDGTDETRRAPVPVAGLGTGLRDIAAGARHSCAIDAAGAVWCWGQNLHGQLGDATTEGSLEPVRVIGLP